jgi:hypothetical protein
VCRSLLGVRTCRNCCFTSFPHNVQCLGFKPKPFSCAMPSFIHKGVCCSLFGYESLLGARNCCLASYLSIVLTFDVYCIGFKG